MKFQKVFLACVAMLSIYSLPSWSAQEQLLDLDTLNLRLDATSTSTVDINYPGYKLGGGAPAKIKIRDCLVLDIKDSDNVLTVEQKLKLADAFNVVEFGKVILKPEAINNAVVYFLRGNGMYMTYIKAESKSQLSLTDSLNAMLPNSKSAPVGLVYMRGCRFIL
ncbi:MAG: hypothetical protein V4654_00505 [Bdellovibrionota bacterium]